MSSSLSRALQGVDLISVVGELPQEIDQITQEQIHARVVSHEPQAGRPERATAPAGGSDAGMQALHLSNAVWLAVNGNGCPLIAGGQGKER